MDVVELTIGGVEYRLTYEIHQATAVSRAFPELGDPRALIHKCGRIWVDEAGVTRLRVEDLWALTVMLWATMKPRGKAGPSIETVTDLLAKHLDEGGTEEGIFELLWIAFAQGSHGRRFLESIKKKAETEAENQKSSPTGSTAADTSLTDSDTDRGSSTDSQSATVMQS